MFAIHNIERLSKITVIPTPYPYSTEQKYRLLRFWKRFPYRSRVDSTRRWCLVFAAIHKMEVLS